VYQGIAYLIVFFLCVFVCRKVQATYARQSMLLIASYALYLTWSYWFIAVLLASTVTNFAMGKWLRKTPSPGVLTFGVCLNLALLGVFKYLPEVSVQLPFSSLQMLSHLALPIGVSFWTFQAMSYLFDLYREEDMDPTFLEFALYMALFPVTISGPICRLPDMLPQFRSTRSTPWSVITDGFRRIGIGVFMMLLARLLGQGILSGEGIDSGFDRTVQWSGPDVWCLALGFGLQLFLDFAGYSHIAIGAARALGITVPENFNRPFASANPSIFWTRWHMSLSFWIRDYVFIPLATMRRESWWRSFVLVLSMVLFGVWHRASLLFLLWGTYHGLLLVLHRQAQQLQRKLEWESANPVWRIASWFISIALISLGWILFRSGSVAQARQMLTAALSPTSFTVNFLRPTLYALVAAIATGYAITLLIVDVLHQHSDQMDSSPQRGSFAALLARWRWYWLPPLYVLAVIFLLIATFTRGPSTAQFMYNKF
jgi:alginate O-acetyltransferase complex protein AlgI